MTGGGAETARPIPLRPPRDCPICGRKSVREAYPFCSRRCADVDLGRWLTGAYAIPAGNADDQDQPDEGAAEGAERR